MQSVIFRVDASRSIGTGHVMRCLTLANRLRKREVAVAFVCREQDGHLCDLIKEQGIAVSRLSGLKASVPSSDAVVHVDWLGSSWQEDAEQTRVVIKNMNVRPDWLVVDHYAIDHRWERVLRATVGRILVIDDLADRGHDCDLLLDQNLVACMDSRYSGRVPASCSMMLGPRHALLQPIYAELHDRIPPREGPIRRILMYFGGADSENILGRTLAAFLSLKRSDIEVDVVIAAGSPFANTIRQQVAGHVNIRLHGEMPSLAQLMAQADLAVGAGGATTWERLCLGLPALVVTLAENQRSIAYELSRRGQIRFLGHKDTVSQTTIARALGKLIEQGLDEAWSSHCRSTVDGKGVDRVCAALTVKATSVLRVRHASPEDEDLLLEWANDPTTRRNGFSPETIPAATHRIWFRGRLRNLDGCRLYIVETADGVELGQVRFERQGETWEVHYTVAPVFRGRGLGRFLLHVSLLKFRLDVCGASVFGQVKEDNYPSRKIFEALGFRARPDGKLGVVVYQRTF